MKKKLILLLAISAILVCMFAISVSAATITTLDGVELTVTTYDGAPEKTNIETKLDDVVVFDDGFCCPSAYIFKDSKTTPDGAWSLAFADATDFSWLNEQAEKSYTFSNVVELDIPQGITYVGKFSAYHSETLKRVSFPDSVTSLGGCIFQGASALEECTFEHNANSELTTIPGYMFSDCSSLKAISLPDCITTITGEKTFAKCTSMTAVYLSKKLTAIEECGTRGDLATFDGNSKMYFVSESFTYDSIPEKPTMYYFPENFQTLANNCVFRGNSALNETLVFGDKLTSVSSAYMFEGTGNKTIVFLGDMENITVTKWSTTTIYFANKADLSDSDIPTLSGSQTRIYCNAEGNETHLFEKEVKLGATYLDNAKTELRCFCGHAIETTEIENTALFTVKGYSTDGTSIVFTIVANTDAIDAYNTANGKNVKYGIVASKIQADGALINKDGTIANDSVLSADFTGTQYTMLQIKIVGAASAPTTSLHCCAYVTDGTSVAYLYEEDKKATQGETANQVSYSQVAPDEQQ